MRFVRFVARDLALGALTAVAWKLDARARSGVAATVTGLTAGLMTGLVGFLAHEWGHLAGSIVSGGVVHEPASVTSPFLFNFDVEKSSRASFLGMSYGGYAGTLAATAVIVALAPRETLAGRVAIGATVLGLVATFALELPTTIAVARGGPLPVGGVYAGDPTARAE